MAGAYIYAGTCIISVSSRIKLYYRRGLKWSRILLGARSGEEKVTR